MIKTKKKIKYDAARPKDKATLVFTYGNQMLMVKDKIEIAINHYKVTENGQLEQLKVNNPTVVMKMEEFNEITKDFDLDMSEGWISALLNQETIVEIMIDQMGKNSELFYGLKSKDLEPLPTS